MGLCFDDLENGAPDARAAAIAVDLPAQIARVQALPGYVDSLSGVVAGEVTDAEPLAEPWMLRKSVPGGFAGGVSDVFQSPTPICEPGQVASRDWWSLGRFVHAIGFGPDDILENRFTYHLAPARGRTCASAAGWGGPTGGQGDGHVRAARAGGQACRAPAGGGARGSW